MQTRSAFISLVGRTNAGKSSLLNRLLGEKLSIVSDKPQTTRTRITGILTEGVNQYVFIDTPGFHKSKTKLSSYMIKSAESSIGDVDMVIFIVEAQRGIGDIEENIIAKIKQSKVPCVAVINKIDLVEDKADIMPIMTKLQSLYDFDEIIPISVKDNDGVSIVKEILSRYTEESPHYFPDDMLTDQPERVLVSEIIREKALRFLDKEVPHGIAVGIESINFRDDKDLVDITATIYCERDSHKGIIIGKGGTMLKKIGTASRLDLENFFGIKVNLQCWVKVKEDWRNKEGSIQNFGFTN